MSETIKYGPGVLRQIAEELCEPETSEAYFADRERFVNYVREKVNPAREAEELSTCTPALAEHLYDVITSRRYRAKS